MKPFTKRLALVMGLLFTALICLGFVYIDTLSNYWQYSGGFIRLVVNTNAQASITVDTNTMQFGINTNNSTFSVMLRGRTPTNLFGATSTDSTTVGAIQEQAGDGGSTTITTTGVGGAGGAYNIFGGDGGFAPNATTNATGGAGGNLNITSGNGGPVSGASQAATNSITGGKSGDIFITAGTAGRPTFASTNNVGGAGGSIQMTAAGGATPSTGFTRKPGNGGSFTFLAGAGGTGRRTNASNGGGFSMTAGAGGVNSVTPGNGGPGGGFGLTAGNAGSAAAGGNAGGPGEIALKAGAGATGDTNSNGGNITMTPGASGGTSARDGNVILAVNGTSPQGFVGIRIPNPQQALDVQGNAQVSSNLFYTNLTVLVATNSTANTNIVIDYAQAYTDIYLTNNASFTNWVNAGTSRAGSINIFITIPGSGTNTLVWPTLGAPSFGVYWQTNQNSSMFTSATGGNTYAFSDTWAGTNHKVSLTVWK